MVVRSRNLARITLVVDDRLPLGETDLHAMTMRMKSDDDPVMDVEAFTNLQLRATNLRALDRDC